MDLNVLKPLNHLLPLHSIRNKLQNSRILNPINEDEAIKIYGRNIAVNEENSKRLNKLDGPLYSIKAIHIPANRKVNVNANGTIETTSFLEEVQIKVGCRIMLINNVDTSDGLVNGAQGTVQSVLTHENKVHYVLVKFDNKKIGAQQRRKLNFLEKITNVGQAVPIERVNFSYTLGKRNKSHGASASFFQLPLKLAWSKTAHKVNYYFKLLLVDPLTAGI